jgi:hypothetical protein
VLTIFLAETAIGQSIVATVALQGDDGDLDRARRAALGAQEALGR